jgi:hypothetical protein
VTSSSGAFVRVVAAALATALGSGALAIWLASPPRHPVPPAVPAPIADVPPAPGEEPAPAPVGAAPPPAPPAPAPAAPRPRATAKVRAPVALPEPPPREPIVELEELLRLPPPEPPGPQSLDLAGEQDAATEAERERARRIQLDYSRETLLRDVPTQPERRRTDVGVSMRVGEEDRLRVRGGVRVESKEGEEESETSPNVGVEVRF